ncbi:MAG: hypothetical protein KDD00_15475 [Ignavibacteriae bacterium]|nr:hypothetical protein [Ignavibacteriota bacterium]
MKTPIYLFVFFLVIFSIFCQGKKNISLNSNCDSINKMDSLIQDVLFKEYLYSYGPNDSIRKDFILESKNISIKKIYKNEFQEPIYVINQNQIDTMYGGIIKFDLIEFSSDSLNVKLKVKFFSPSNKYLRTINLFEYTFDSLKCKWKLIDSTINVH